MSRKKKSSDRATRKEVFVPKAVKDCVEKFLNGTPTSEKFALFHAIAKGNNDKARKIFENVLNGPQAGNVTKKLRVKMTKLLEKPTSTRNAA